MDIVGQRIISPGAQSQIPCLACGHHYEAHCVTHLDGESYQVLTCRACGNWHYYDDYVDGRWVVQEHVGIDLCEWRVCPVTGLRYMVRVASDPPANYWDEVIEELARAGDDRERLTDLLLNVVAFVGEDMEYWDVSRMTVRIMQMEIQDWIDRYSD